MKATILFFALLLFQTGQAQEMNCTSVDVPLKSLKITVVQDDLVKVQQAGELIEQIFVGSLVPGPTQQLLVTTFEVYNQHGEPFELSLKKQFNFPSHCRARYCPPAPWTPKAIAKLSSTEMVDEYYNCL